MHLSRRDKQKYEKKKRDAGWLMKGERGASERKKKSQAELIERQRRKAKEKDPVERANERAVRAARWWGALL